MMKSILAILLTTTPVFGQVPVAPAPHNKESFKVVTVEKPEIAVYEKAKSLTLSGDYEASLVLLTTVKQDRLIYNEYCFLMAVNNFALNRKIEAEKWIKNLDDTFEPMTKRHAAVLYAMKQDIQQWKEGDLSDIERDMRKAADRLTNAQGGSKTQAIQKEIVNKLDKLIKEQEDKAAAAAAAAAAAKAAKGAGQQLPGPGTQTPQEAAKESIIMGGKGDGKVDEKVLRKIAESWGSLPAKDRAKVIQEMTRDLPPKFEPMIKNYFDALEKMHPKK